ncbi:hypothetical protein AMTR_s00131p00115080 [Amborella trichopoda]|uniref:Uncharacterized protein n=1 Tax=Amborella trichopoda TaxID=13333 RepID=W1NR83_AMBTC|nr:hypothetical protein AMTR_s00131p00115080 [Amborella trichopoda]
MNHLYVLDVKIGVFWQLKAFPAFVNPSHQIGLFGSPEVHLLLGSMAGVKEFETNF